MSTVSNPAPVPKPSLSECFRTADTNADRVLSLEEVKAISERWVSEHLASGSIQSEGLRWHDANGDGNMSLAEMQAAQANPQVYRLQPGEIALDGDTLSYRIADLFGFADQLGGVVDDLITAEETAALGLDFITFHDGNGDGLMSRADCEAHKQTPEFGSAEQSGSITELRIERGRLKTDLAKYIVGRLIRGEGVTKEELRYLESNEGSENLFAGDDWDTWMRFTQAQASDPAQAWFSQEPGQVPSIPPAYVRPLNAEGYVDFSSPDDVSRGIGEALLWLSEMGGVMSRLEYIASGGSRPDNRTWTLKGVELLAKQGMQSGIYTETGRIPMSDQSAGDEYANAGEYEARDRNMALDAAQFLLRPEVQAQLAQELGTNCVFSKDSAWDAAQKILDRYRTNS